MKAIRVEEQGGPEVMVCQDVELPPPAPDQVQVELAAIGVNFRDLYQRSGEYPMKLPYTPGTEGAGTILAVGDEVSGFRVGERVGYYGALGAYAEMSNVPARRAIKLPDDCSFERAAAVMGQGTTAHYLVHSCYPLKAGETCLVHAAAGGLGLLMVQMAKRIGATVIGTTSTEAKGGCGKGRGRRRGDHIHGAGLRGGGQADYGRGRGTRGLRQCREDHLRPEPEMPQASGVHGAVRAVERAGTAVQSAGIELAGIPVPYPTFRGGLFLESRGDGMATE